MPIGFFPPAGQILVCDFSGFQPPEMIKHRPVIILSPKLPNRSEIVTLVPLSTTAPRHNLPFVVRLSRNYHPLEDDTLAVWAKCDMVMNVSRQRLDGFKIGRRKWATPMASEEDLHAVRIGVIHDLGLRDLLKTQV
ncbi:type II toxin-antitoxin system PemK/MazF family toxin [Pannonibacter carbonis]|uniref:type II toxin-antitoxin system PemK/MazF family toxin n=1 Tax=Pannonibacter carbonis TaxID=2067569 RepID=UPI000D0EB740|nr:type II toxin-antitoxin system PemK/MazF family toxin [Pannonibacter carbonis]